MSESNLQSIFDQALACHQAGRLHEAAQLYRQVLVAQPGHADALHMLGVAHAQLGDDIPTATSLVRRAIALRPGVANYHANLGNMLQDAGQVDEAIAEYRQAMSLAPNIAEIHNNLGNALQKKGDLDQALSAYEKALGLRTAFPEAHFNRGNALQKKSRFDDSVAAYRAALALRPEYADAWLGLGIALFGRTDADGAIDAYRRALALNGGLVDAHANLGRAFLYAGRHDEAIAAFSRALAIRRDEPDVEHDLGNALRESRRLDEAIAAYRRSLVPRPEFADSHFGLAWTYLLKGDYPLGWSEYEWRSGLRDSALFARRFAEPRWDGSRLDGGRILLYAEQGFGDTFLTFRYVPMVVARGGRVVVQCPRPVLRLLQAQHGIERAIEDGQDPGPIEVQCPLMSLPGVFGTTLETIPANVPYVVAPPDTTEQWKQRLGNLTNAINVGLAWSGKPIPRNRAIPLSMLAPLAGIAGVRLHSLQVGPAAAAIWSPGAPEGMADWSNQLTDFAETAGLVANLDLVISIDTAVAHLAGAMGKRVWVMLPYVADWRWLLHRCDSPWFPTMRLFRQPRVGVWSPVIAQVVAELRSLAAR